MFCKWCGERIDPGQRKCASCGREIPPLSDCGGFYGLVQNLHSGAQEKTEPVQPNVQPPEPAPARNTRPPAKRPKRRWLSGAILMLIPLLLLIWLISMQVSLIKIKNQQEEILQGLRLMETEAVGGDANSNENGTVPVPSAQVASPPTPTPTPTPTPSEPAEGSKPSKG